MLMFHDGRYIQPEEEDVLAPGSPKKTRLSSALELARTMKDCRKMRKVARPLPPPRNGAAANEDDDAIDASEKTRYTLLRQQLVDHFWGWNR